MHILELPGIGEDFVPGIDMHIPIKDIERSLTKCIGVGGYGRVYKGQWGGVEVAVKRLPPVDDKGNGNQSSYDSMIKEINLMSKFDCERIVKVLGASTDDRDNCCLVMELLRGGDLAKKIHDPKRRRLSYIQILQITQDIAEGLAYLHPFVTHRDLKPGNVLLDENGRAKIGDFGISKVKELDKTFFSDTIAFNGTIMYMAPEQLNGGKLDEKVDVYALGVIMNEMYTRKWPWPSEEPRMMFQILRMVGMEGKRPWIDPDTPDGLKRLIQKCWSQSPKDRPSCAEVVKTTEILIREELKRLEDRGASSSCEIGSVRSSLGRWSSAGLSSVGTGYNFSSSHIN
jgi:serine/threonine protein kinase